MTVTFNQWLSKNWHMILGMLLTGGVGAIGTGIIVVFSLIVNYWFALLIPFTVLLGTYGIYHLDVGANTD